MVAKGSEPALQTDAHVEAGERVSRSWAEKPALDFQAVISGAFSSGSPGGVSAPRLALVPKLGWLVTHEGTAADRLELPTAEICSLLSSFQQQQPAGGCLLPPSPPLRLFLPLIHY